MKLRILTVLLITSIIQAHAMQPLVRASCQVRHHVTQLFPSYKHAIIPKANYMSDESRKEGIRSRIAGLKEHIETLNREIEHTALYVRKLNEQGLGETNLVKTLELNILNKIDYSITSKNQISSLEKDLKK